MVLEERWQLSGRRPSARQCGRAIVRDERQPQ
jgi:hypothetical protein